MTACKKGDKLFASRHQSTNASTNPAINQQEIKVSA
jgi:hypothetical protein